jgi:hypothetical protein
MLGLLPVILLLVKRRRAAVIFDPTAISRGISRNSSTRIDVEAGAVVVNTAAGTLRFVSQA